MKNLELLRQLAPIIRRLDRKTHVNASDFDEYEIKRIARNIFNREDSRPIEKIENFCALGWIAEQGAFQLLNEPCYYDFQEVNNDRILVHKSLQESWKDRERDLTVFQELDLIGATSFAKVWGLEIKLCSWYQLEDQFCFNTDKSAGYIGIDISNFLKSKNTDLIVLLNKEDTKTGWNVWGEGIIHRKAFDELPMLPTSYSKNQRPQFYYWWHDLIDNNLAIRLNIDARFSNSDF